jgi:hypothetical protein
MLTRKRTLVGVLATVLVLMATTGTVAHAESTAQAETTSVLASCYGPSCAGLDPVAYRCHIDAVTLHDIVINGVSGYRYHVEHRYSRACNASWTRLSNYHNPDCTFGARAWHEARWTDGRRSRTPYLYIGPSCAGTSVMMSEHNKSTRACAWSDWEGRTRCTFYKNPG